jgi:hypothetical protein
MIMRNINWEDNGSSLEIVQAINSKEVFTVLVTGQLAQAFISILGVARVGISPETARLLIVVTIILALAGLTLFALARGYKVSGKATTPNGQEYELIFEPKA